MLAKYEGLFIEPASASSIAGLKKLIELEEIDKNEVIVCVATGHGLKDPDVIMQTCERPFEVDAEVKSVEVLLGPSS